MKFGNAGYKWPGNIRELENILKRALIISDNGILDTDSLAFYTKNKIHTDETLKSHSNDTERGIIIKHMISHSGDIPIVCENLGISRSSLYRKLKKYEIRRTDFYAKKSY